MKESFGPARARSVITKLADQVEAINKERDFLAMANKDLSEAMARYQQVQEAAKLALDALEDAQKYAHNVGKYLHGVPQAITALRQAGIK